MDELVELSEIPVADEIYMIVGWHQWADAGAISSGLPEYLIELTNAHKIGEIRPDGFYLFQVPQFLLCHVPASLLPSDCIESTTMPGSRPRVCGGDSL